MNQIKILQIDVNEASLEELTSVSGLNSSLAEAIILNRPFHKFEDLTRVKGIGPTSLEKFRQNLKISPININQTTQKELESLPGISRELAEKITAARPFSDLEELKNIQGIKENLYLQILPYLQLSEMETVREEETPIFPPAVEEETPQEPVLSKEKEYFAVGQSTQSVFSEAEAEAEPEQKVSRQEKKDSQPKAIQIVPTPPDKKEPEPPQKAEKGLTRAEMLTWVAAGSLLSLFLAIILSLGILGLTNSGLSYVTDAEGRQQTARLEEELQVLNSQAETMQQDIDGLRTRIDSLERLSGRISTLEENAVTLREDIDLNTAQLQDFETSLEKLSEDTARALEMGAKYESFLEGLKNLLTELMP